MVSQYIGKYMNINYSALVEHNVCKCLTDHYITHFLIQMLKWAIQFVMHHSQQQVCIH